MSNTANPLQTEPADAVRHAAEKNSTVTLSITNTEDKKVAWKLKCSSNAMFKIKNPTGLLGPNATGSTVLTMIGDVNKADPPKKHRYVLFSIYTDKGNAREAWKEATDANGPKAGTRKTLNIVFEAEGGEAAAAAEAPAEPAEAPAEGMDAGGGELEE